MKLLKRLASIRLNYLLSKIVENKFDPLRKSIKYSVVWDMD